MPALKKKMRGLIKSDVRKIVMKLNQTVRVRSDGLAVPTCRYLPACLLAFNKGEVQITQSVRAEAYRKCLVSRIDIDYRCNRTGTKCPLLFCYE